MDAICINQNDIPEREAQVSIMHHIYATATDVIAWIGKDNGAPDRRAIAFARELGARGRSYLNAGHGGSDVPLDEETFAWFESITPFGLVDSIWLDFTALLERPWFSRIWIVQEVVMGKQVTVQCGPHQFEWTELFYCAIFVEAHASLLESLAAPGCLKDHDPKSAEFYFKSFPLQRLGRATDRSEASATFVHSSGCRHGSEMSPDRQSESAWPHSGAPTPTNPSASWAC